MSPSRRRAPRLAMRTTIAILLVALGAAMSPLVSSATAAVLQPEPSNAEPAPAAAPSTPLDKIPLYPLLAPRPDPWLPVPGRIRPASLLPGLPLDSPHVVGGLTSDGCAYCHRASTASEAGLTVAAYRSAPLTTAADAYVGTDFGLCFQCHSETPFEVPYVPADPPETAFGLHARHVGDIAGFGTGGTEIKVPGDGQGNAICAECHFQLHQPAAELDGQLVGFAPNVLPRSGVLQWTGGGSPTCTLNCHGVSHRAAGYAPAAEQNATLGVDARISVVASDTNLVGDPHTFTITVQKNPGTVWGPAPDIAVNVTEAGVGSMDLDASTCDDSPTDSAGQCVVVVDSSVPGTSTVNATATVSVEGVVGPVIVDVSTTGHGAFIISNVKTWVDARISIGPAGTNLVGDEHTITVTVEKHNGSGWAPAAGISVNGSVAGDGLIDFGASTCDDSVTDSSGECAIVVNSGAPGAGTVDASGAVIVGGVWIPVSTSRSVAWVDARISIEPSATDLVVGGPAHTFTVTVEQNDGTGWAPVGGIAVTPSEVGDGAITGGSCGAGVTDGAGQCTIVVNSSAAGTSTVDASATIVVGGVSIPVSTAGYGAYVIFNTVTWVVP